MDNEIIIVLIIILALGGLFVYQKKNKNDVLNSELNKDFANSEERLALNAKALGLDLSEIKEGMRCAYKPPCENGFVENLFDNFKL